jgi:ferric-dicitrate binding protein FerR (iron transport regulator)
MKTTSGATAAALTALLLSGSALRAQQQPPTATPSATAVQAAPNPEAIPSPSPAPAVPAYADSKVRIVRLSQVNGQVQLDRNIGKGFEQARANLPIVEGARLQTGSGVAEVELEDNSTLRMAPDTLVEFPVLELRPTGVKTSTVNVVKGTVYVSLLNNKENDFTLAFGHGSLPLPPASHVRLQLEPGKATLAVLNGEVPVPEASGSELVTKKKTVTFDLSGQDQPAVAKHVADNDYDAWDQQAFDYHKQYANANAFGNSPYSYGVSDLNYYGSFVTAGGCGGMWRPYFVSAAWNPYSNGAWAWYSGAGYSWVSPYPWGWTPYHYGSWSYCSGTGWGWMPGGSWMGLANAPVAFNRLQGPGVGSRPVMPPRPVGGHPATIEVNERPLPASRINGEDTFLFSKDSAGLGVPRGSLGKLEGFSKGVDRHGAVVTQVYSAPMATVRETQGRSGGGTMPGSELRSISRSPGNVGRSGSGGAGSNGAGGAGLGAGMGAGSMGAGGMSHGGSGGAPSGGHR